MGPVVSQLSKTSGVTGLGHVTLLPNLRLEHAKLIIRRWKLSSPGHEQQWPPLWSDAQGRKENVGQDAGTHAELRIVHGSNMSDVELRDGAVDAAALRSAELEEFQHRAHHSLGLQLAESFS